MPLAPYLQRGVVIPAPGMVWIDPALPPENLAPGVVLLPGTRLEGSGNWMGPGCVISGEGPATLSDCVLEKNVVIQSGFCEGSLFLDGASVGNAAHIRPGCILEEQASTAHSVGLKQTILFPFVTLGSLINFCDCLMAGGTSRKNHSEVGSSFVHFNFTPQGDKATASLFGDVVSGVFLDQPPIFLGGQGGAVGPISVAYGSVLAAGSILRRSIEAPNQLIRTAASSQDSSKPYHPSARHIELKIALNRKYLGQLHALRAWYGYVRAAFFSHPRLLEHGLRLLHEALEERLNRLKQFCVLHDQAWNPAAFALPEVEPPSVEIKPGGGSYLAWMECLPSNEANVLRRWLCAHLLEA